MSPRVLDSDVADTRRLPPGLPPISEAAVSSVPASAGTPGDERDTAVRRAILPPGFGPGAKLFGTYELIEMVGEGGISVPASWSGGGILKVWIVGSQAYHSIGINFS